MENLQNIKAIIFDLGGVILNIDPKLSVIEFKKLGLENFEQQYSILAQSHIFDLLEKGAINPTEFRNKIRGISNVELLDEEIDHAWNILLLDFPPHRIELIQQLKKNYPIYLLSNTNFIHYQKYTVDFKHKFNGIEFSSLFDKEFLSFEMDCRKPEPEIYHKVINSIGIDPSELLFIDDNLVNADAAIKCGIRAIHLQSGMDIRDIFTTDNGIKL